MNTNKFTPGADTAGANCLDGSNSSTTTFRSAAVACGGTDWHANLPTRERFKFSNNVIYNSFANAGNGSWGANWGVPVKVSKLPRIKFEGVQMLGTGGIWFSAFDHNVYWSDQNTEVLRLRGFMCNSSNPPGQNWPGCSFQSWQALHDQHGRITDPQFVSPKTGDFRLGMGSPALAMGTQSIEPDFGPRSLSRLKTDDEAELPPPPPHVPALLPARATASRHLKYMTFFGDGDCNATAVAAMVGWSNLCISGNLTNLNRAMGFGMAPGLSLIDAQNILVQTPGQQAEDWAVWRKPNGACLRNASCADTWNGLGARWKDTVLCILGKPELMVRSVSICQNRSVPKLEVLFLGDELLDGGISLANLTTVADFARTLLPRVVIWTNEGLSAFNRAPTAPSYMSAVPTALDMISIDYCEPPACPKPTVSSHARAPLLVCARCIVDSGVLSAALHLFEYLTTRLGSDATMVPTTTDNVTIPVDEAAQVAAIYRTLVFPRMSPHQQVMLVPGTVGCVFNSPPRDGNMIMIRGIRVCHACILRGLQV